MNNNFFNHKYSKKVVRRDYSKIKTNFELPDLLETQKGSFVKFLNEELEKIIKSIFPIDSPQNKYTLKVNKIELGSPRKTEDVCRDESKTYDAPLYVDLQLINNETGEIKKAKATGSTKGIFFGNIPLMTEKGTFIINGIEKFVIAQIIRSPGMYVLNKSQIKLNNSRKRIIQGNICELLPYKGSLMLFHIPSTNKEYEKVVQISARNSSGELVASFLGTTLLKGYGLSESEIREIYDNEQVIINTLAEEKYNSKEILEFNDIQLLYKELNNEKQANESPDIILQKGSYIERKLRKLIYELIELEDSNATFKENNKSLSKDDVAKINKNNEKIK
ncbi:hypothetical protein IKE96_03765 [bacterium]|nr:hypothetical protein [bacterium]